MSGFSVCESVVPTLALCGEAAPFLSATREAGTSVPSGEKPMPQTLVLCAVAAAATAAALLIPSDVWRLLSCGLAGRFSSGNHVSTPRIFSKAELSRYTGGKGSPGLYLAVLGQVFDVDRGRRHYGPGGSYHFFTGRDASKAFVSGDFTELGLTDDVSGLSPTEMLSLHEWLTFYKREYIFKGKLVGTYYDHNGEPTQALIDAELLTEQGRKLKAELEEENKVFPPCNSEWTSTKGGRVWCSTHRSVEESKGIGWVSHANYIRLDQRTIAVFVCVQMDLHQINPIQLTTEEIWIALSWQNIQDVGVFPTPVPLWRSSSVSQVCNTQTILY